MIILALIRRLFAGALFDQAEFEAHIERIGRETLR